MDDPDPWFSLLGDLPTAFAVLISYLGLRREWHHHQENRRSEERNRLTIAAATFLAKFERRRQRYLDYFFHVRPHFITASEKLSDGESWEVVRNYLWKELETEQSRIIRELGEDEIETAYAHLAASDPAHYTDLRRALDELNDLAKLEFRGFRKDSQLSLPDSAANQPTASVSTKLRLMSEARADEFAKRSESIVEPVRHQIQLIIQDASVVTTSKPPRPRTAR